MRALRELEPPAQDEGWPRSSRWRSAASRPRAGGRLRRRRGVGARARARRHERAAPGLRLEPRRHLRRAGRGRGPPRRGGRRPGRVGALPTPRPADLLVPPPLPGLPLAFARAHGIDPARSLVVGTGPRTERWRRRSAPATCSSRPAGPAAAATNPGRDRQGPRAQRSAPIASAAIPIQSTESSSAPIESSDDTPRDPSSFIKTARQSPSSPRASARPSRTRTRPRTSRLPAGPKARRPSRSYDWFVDHPLRRRARRLRDTRRRPPRFAIPTKTSFSLSLRIRIVRGRRRARVRPRPRRCRRSRRRSRISPRRSPRSVT